MSVGSVPGVVAGPSVNVKVRFQLVRVPADRCVPLRGRTPVSVSITSHPAAEPNRTAARRRDIRRPAHHRGETRRRRSAEHLGSDAVRAPTPASKHCRANTAHLSDRYSPTDASAACLQRAQQSATGRRSPRPSPRRARAGDGHDSRWEHHRPRCTGRLGRRDRPRRRDPFRRRDRRSGRARGWRRDRAGASIGDEVTIHRRSSRSSGRTRYLCTPILIGWRRALRSARRRGHRDDDREGGWRRSPQLNILVTNS